MELPNVGAGPFHGGPSISCGAPPEDQMSVAASESGLESSGDEAESSFRESNAG